MHFKNDSLFLTKLELFIGKGFRFVDKIAVDLVEVFPDKVKEKQVFGDWVSGIVFIQFGENKEDESIAGYIEFHPSELVYTRFENGICLEKYTVNGDFNIHNIPSDTDECLKKMLSEGQ